MPRQEKRLDGYPVIDNKSLYELLLVGWMSIDHQKDCLFNAGNQSVEKVAKDSRRHGPLYRHKAKVPICVD
jgi:hypothetical protein